MCVQLLQVNKKLRFKNSIYYEKNKHFDVVRITSWLIQPECDSILGFEAVPYYKMITTYHGTTSVIDTPHG